MAQAGSGGAGQGPAARPGRDVLVHLGAAGASLAAGTAELRFRLQLAGSDARYPADIHFGTCAGGGPAAYALRDLLSGPDGTARSTTAVPEVPVVPPAGWFIAVYAGPAFDPERAAPVACGDVALRGPLFSPGALLRTCPVTVALSMQDGSAANGTAGLAFWRPGVLSVTLVCNSLPPHSVHPADIRFGTCAGGGPIGHPLRDVVADAHDDAVRTTEIPGLRVIPPLGWSIHVYAGPTGAGPGAAVIACGDVRPAAPVIPPPL